ncbi:hypothetical protein [Halomonas rhizosphaerae]|uniref:ArsR family transcriptional regulator n=1 Tax=Halomonas rhizosphaerae TaxID=3043296 RepID=A0ABT6UXC1_9GAMM|nr:hypothetical protein [Halomonas rhizosphaerae]MDI5890627.1 hypothetical protein [Halomonas rhizosphaerae]
MTITLDPDRQVLRALADRINFESTTRLDVIMAHVRHTEMTWGEAEETLRRLQMLGCVRSLSPGHWFITREGLATLRQHLEALAREACDG